MIQGLDTQVNVRQATATTATTAARPAEPTAEAEQQASTSGITLQHPTDRVEISEKGYASLTAAAAKTDEATAKAVVAAVAATDTEETTAKAVTDAVAEATEAAKSSTTNLTSLTAQQLEQLVKDGSITRAQADTELARRQGGTAEAE